MSSRIPLTTARSNLVAGVLACVLAAGGGWVFLVGPTTSELGETRAALDDTVDVNNLLTVRLHGLERQRDELATTVAQADDLAVAFPPTADQPGFFAMVDQAARAAGIGADRVTAVSPSAPLPALAGSLPGDPAGGSTDDPSAPVDASTLLAVQSVVVSVEGPRDRLEEFLANLEQMDRALLVQLVALTTDEEGTRVEVTGTTYVAPPLVAPELDAEGRVVAAGTEGAGGTGTGGTEGAAARGGSARP